MMEIKWNVLFGMLIAVVVMIGVIAVWAKGIKKMDDKGYSKEEIEEEKKRFRVLVVEIAMYGFIGLLGIAALYMK